MQPRLLISVLALAALLAGACGVKGGDGTLRALPRGGGGAGAVAESAALMADDAAGAARYRTVVYQAGEGLGAGLPTSAPAYELTGEPSAADVRRLARLLGMSGEVTSESPSDGAGFRVVDGDLLLEVQRAPGGPWYASDQRDSAGVATACAVAVEPDRPVSAEKAGAAAASPEPACVDQQPAPVAGLLSPEAAQRRAREILDGLDHKGVTYTVEADGASGGQATLVNVAVAIGGRPVPTLGSWFAFGAEGKVLAANGWLGTFEPIGDYPLAGVDVGIDRLNAGGSGPRVLGIPEPAIAPATPAPACPPEADCVAPEGGGAPGPSQAPPPEPEVVVLDKVRLGYNAVFGPCAGDPLVLVPAYLFAVPDSGGSGEDVELSAEAVTDDLLASQAQDAEDARPCPGTAGDEPGREPKGGGGVAPGSPGSGTAEPGVERDPRPAPVAPPGESEVGTTTR